MWTCSRRGCTLCHSSRSIIPPVCTAPLFQRNACCFDSDCTHTRCQLRSTRFGIVYSSSITSVLVRKMWLAVRHRQSQWYNIRVNMLADLSLSAPCTLHPRVKDVLSALTPILRKSGSTKGRGNSRGSHTAWCTNYLSRLSSLSITFCSVLLLECHSLTRSPFDVAVLFRGRSTHLRGLNMVFARVLLRRRKRRRLLCRRLHIPV